VLVRSGKTRDHIGA
jgi:hypothetical protein